MAEFSVGIPFLMLLKDSASAAVGRARCAGRQSPDADDSRYLFGWLLACRARYVMSVREGGGATGKKAS